MKTESVQIIDEISNLLLKNNTSKIFDNNNINNIKNLSYDNFCEFVKNADEYFRLIYLNEKTLFFNKDESNIHYFLYPLYLMLANFFINDKKLNENIDRYIIELISINQIIREWKLYPEEKLEIFGSNNINSRDKISSIYNIKNIFRKYFSEKMGLYSLIEKSIQKIRGKDIDDVYATVNNKKIKDINNKEQNINKKILNKRIPNKRKTLSRSIRRAVFKQDKYICVYCGVRTVPFYELSPEEEKDYPNMGSIDHMDPFSDDLYNLVTSCRSCNSRKNQNTPDQAKMIPKYGRFAKIKYQDYIKKFMQKGERNENTTVSK